MQAEPASGPPGCRHGGEVAVVEGRPGRNNSNKS